MHLTVLNFVLVFAVATIGFVLWTRASKKKWQPVHSAISAFLFAILFFSSQLLDIPRIAHALGTKASPIEIAKASGRIIGTNDSFTGAAWAGRLTHPGIFVKTVSGIECMGSFRYTKRTAGDGHFQCDDGRTGEFQFTTRDLLTGEGVGTLGHDKIEFSFAPNEAEE